MTTQPHVYETSMEAQHNAARPNNSRRTRIIIWLTTIVSVLHHVDHVLRADHSGWPFIENFSPFTISVVAAYSVVAFVLFVRGRLWMKFALVSVAYFLTQGAHIFLETPEHQYITWAANASPITKHLGEPNLLDIASPAMGAYAVILSLALSAFLIATMVSTYLDARQATQ